MAYRIEEAEFALPSGWRDHSMNVFRLPGVKDASLIITRDSESPIDDPQQYAEKQQAAAKEQFAAYRALSADFEDIDGQPAFVVEYQWRGSGVALLQQRQAFVHHRGAMLVLTLTALADNFEQHRPAWEDFLDSLRLREEAPATDVAAANDQSTAPAHLPGLDDTYVFALRASERALHVLPQTEDPGTVCNAKDVQRGLWEFFDTAGTSLRWHDLRLNWSGASRTTPGSFELLPRSASDPGTPLTQRLGEVPYLKVTGALSDRSLVRAHLNRVAEDHLES